MPLPNLIVLDGAKPQMNAVKRIFDSHPGLPRPPIVGATKIEHLESAVRALDVKLSADQIRALEEPYQPHPVRGH